MKPDWKSFLCILLVCLLFLPGARGEMAPQPILTPGEAETFVRTFLTGDAESLNTQVLVTDELHTAIASFGGFSGLVRSLASLGNIKEIGSVSTVRNGNLTEYHVPCRFTAMAVDLVLVVQDGAVAGLVTSPFTGVEESQAETEADENGQSVPLNIPVPELDGELPGVLTLPDGTGPFPAVVLVHGSGPSDRDETVMQQKPFLDLAYGLAKQGIAVYRYDKRTYVYGSKLAEDVTLNLEDETIEDALHAVQMLADRDEIDPKRIVVLGHSLGGMAIPALDRSAEEQAVRPAGYILMAAPARRLDVIMREQLHFLDSFTQGTEKETGSQTESALKQLDRLEEIDSLADTEKIAGAYVPYWKWLMQYDPLDAAGSITVPCLVLQGQEDYQVTMQDFGLWKEAVLNRSNWQFIAYPGLVHTFVQGEKSEGNMVYARNAHVEQQVISDIAEFVRSVDP